MLNTNSTFFPHILSHCLNYYDQKKDAKMKSLSDVRTRQLKQVVLIKFLEYTAFQFNKLRGLEKKVVKVEQMVKTLNLHY